MPSASLVSSDRPPFPQWLTTSPRRIASLMCVCPSLRTPGLYVYFKVTLEFYFSILAFGFFLIKFQAAFIFILFWFGFVCLLVCFVLECSLYSAPFTFLDDYNILTVVIFNSGWSLVMYGIGDCSWITLYLLCPIAIFSVTKKEICTTCKWIYSSKLKLHF